MKKRVHLEAPRPPAELTTLSHLRRQRRPATDTPTRLLRAGEVLDGHYEVVELIGAGGMAEVYLGFDRWLKREVAIKATPRELASHLEREAQALASFQHPGLVAAHAYGHHKRTPYVVLEYLRGASLTQQLSARGGEPFPIDSALRTVVGICEALKPLHDRGFVHCDLKPGNIMCTPDRVVLIDLGLVWDSQSERLDGRSSGSPPFMAPEVIADTVQREQGHLIDVYAVGMILYVLVAGRTPFGDADPTATMTRQLTEEAPPLSSTGRDLPPRLSEIVASLIHRDPGQRPGDVMTVRDALLGVPRRDADRH